MPLTSESFQARLREGVQPVYLISGDEPLLVGEAADAVRARARVAGCDERQVFFFEGKSGSWDDVRQAATAMSLFAASRLIEIRMPSGRPGLGAAALLALIEAAASDLVVLIITGKLDREVKDSEWVRAVQGRGSWLELWPVERARLPQWLGARLRDAGLRADEQAITLLAERTEGNLLAARQEIDKLALLAPTGRIGVEEVLASSSDSARFNVFQLGEAVRSGDTARALRVLSGLLAEGAEPVLVLWSLNRELHGQQPGANGAGAARGWGRRAPAQVASQRSRLPYARLLARAARADRMAKGGMEGGGLGAWDELTLLAVEICGLAAVPPSPLAIGRAGHETTQA